jgi:serine/threonine protein kinase/ActR/RegA family two-component response regulator
VTVRSILVADTDQEFQEKITSALKKNGYQIASVSNGLEAIQRIQSEKPDLLILDLQIQEMSGEEVAKYLKTSPEFTHLPIIVFTARNDLKTMVNCLEMGVEEYFVKPMELEELVARIKRFFRLMDQWRNAPTGSSTPVPRTRGVSDTTASLGKITKPTIFLPEQSKTTTGSGKMKAAGAPSRTEKSSYGVYRIENVAGTGGMGIVYKAHDQSLDRYVAVKVLSKEWSSVPEFVSRFRREAKLIAALNHPGIAQIFTFAEEQGELYFALQWCPGGSLANQIRSQGKIELLPAIDIILQCGRALEAASSKGVVHRDIKPSNLMFDENQQVKIVDFGIASSEKMPEKVDPTAVVGSPAYMSPEQGRGRSTDHRSDIYSLGITLYQMLFGRLPFSADSPLGYVEKHTASPFPAYDDLGGTIPHAAYKIIEKMTQKSPRTRYQTYSELNKDLERLRHELYSQRRLKIPKIFNIKPTPNLRSTEFYDLISEVYRTEKMGVLKVTWGSLQKRFFITNNEIIHFESPQPEENSWGLLVNRRLMKKEDIPSPMEDLEESLNRLLYLRAFSPEDFRSVFRELMNQSVMQVFLWPVFEGEFFEGTIEHEPIARIPLSRVLMEAARSMIPIAKIESSFHSDQFIKRTDGFEERMDLLNLSIHENFLVSRVEGDQINLETLHLLTGFAPEQIARTVFALQRAGVLEFVTSAQLRSRRVAERIPMQTPNVPLTPVQEIQPAEIPVQEVKAAETVQPPPKPKKWLDAAPLPDKKLASKSYEQAEAKYKADQYMEASRLCGQAIQNNPKDPRPHFLMARSLAHFPHSVKAAIESFREAISLDEENVEYRLQFVEFLRKCALYQQAFEECELLLELAPHDRNISILLRKLELEK